MLQEKEYMLMVMAKASTLFEIMARDQVDPDEIMLHMNTIYS